MTLKFKDLEWIISEDALFILLTWAGIHKGFAAFLWVTLLFCLFFGIYKVGSAAKATVAQQWSKALRRIRQSTGNIQASQNEEQKDS